MVVATTEGVGEGVEKQKTWSLATFVLASRNADLRRVSNRR